MRTEQYYRALDFAITAHLSYRRASAGYDNYVVHPIEVAAILEADPEIPEEVVIAALLHDTIEDSLVSYSQIAKLFGEGVANIVAEVTDDRRMPRWKQKLDQIEKIKTMGYEALCVKLADRLSNVAGFTSKTPPGETYAIHTRDMLTAFKMRINEVEEGKKIHFRHAIKIAFEIEKAVKQPQ
jgi:guanosine-3',5'-bis(diphosphate) 3'-pyrophosphohydrolase